MMFLNDFIFKTLLNLWALIADLMGIPLDSAVGKV
jgi:hypothetical protein